MTEEENQEEVVAEATEEESAEAQESASLIRKADEQATRIEKANKKQEELLRRQEQILVEAKLGGQSHAGQAPVKKEEVSNEQFANDFREGKVEENILFPKKKNG